MRPWIVGILCLAMLSGCLDSGSDDDGTPPPEPAAPEAEPDWARRAIFGPNHADFGPGDPVEHDHSDRSIHNGSTPNFELLGWTPLTSDYHGQSAGGYYCGEVSEGERKLAVVNSFTSSVAMVVIDVTDPDDPQKLGELVLPRTQIYDSAITADGEFVALATSPLAAATHEDSETTYKLTPMWRDACGNTFQGPTDELPYDSGTLLVDIRDPTQPAVADFSPSPALGPHSVSSATIDGTRYVVSSITNLAYSASFFQFFTVDTLPVLDEGRLTPFSEYRDDYEGDPQTVEGPLDAVHLLNGHVDATLQKHPVTGELIGYLANWDGGLITVRVEQGAATKLNAWGAKDPARGTEATGQIHSAYPLGMWGDRHITVTGQELGGNVDTSTDRRPTGQIVILDTTDPAAPEAVARWTLPVDFVWSGALHFSTHYMAMIDETLFVATYHGGVWAVDASEEQWPDLPTLGVFQPDQDPPEGTATDTSYAPYVLDVLPLGENLVVFDSTSGAYTVRFVDDGSVPPAEPWPDNEFIG